MAYGSKLDRIGYVPKDYLIGGQRLSEQARRRCKQNKRKPVPDFLRRWLDTFKDWLRPRH